MSSIGRRRVVIALLISIGTLLACGDAAGDATARARIAVIPKGTTHVFWKSVEAGARRAAEEHGVDVLWKGPLVENDRAGQIRLVQDFVIQEVDALVLAPLDHRALVGPVRQARAAGIPVVIFDSALDGVAGDDYQSFVATDNHAGGQLAGDELARRLGGEGGVVMLRYQVGSASTDAREGGFLAAVKRHADLAVLSDNRYAGATPGEAKTAALNMIDTLRAADGVFCPNESSTQGMLLALRQEGLLGDVVLVGFDASPPLVAALRAGEIAALVVQDPDGMGSVAVQNAVRSLRGEAVESTVHTDAVLVTADNMDRPEVRRLLP